MRVRAPDGGYSAVEVSSERDLLACRLCVEIEHSEVVSSLFSLEYPVRCHERARERFHVYRPEQVDYQYVEAVHPEDCVPVSGRAVGIVRGSDDDFALIEVMAYLLFAEYVVSSCEDVAPAGQQPVGALRVESVSGAGVFGVADDDVDLFFASETPEFSGNISDGFRPTTSPSASSLISLMSFCIGRTSGTPSLSCDY